MFENVDEWYADGEKPVKYYYNREERIAKAPEIVKKYYRGEMKPVKGIRVFFTKQNRWIFLSLLFFCAATLIYNGMNKNRDYALINTLDCEIQAFSYEEEIYTNLKIKRNKKSENLTDVKKVEAEFFLIDPNNQISEKRSETLIYESGIQYIRTKFTDFDIIRVDVIVSVDGQEKELSTLVKR